MQTLLNKKWYKTGEISAAQAEIDEADTAGFGTANTAEIAALDADFDAASDADFWRCQ